ncbi:hypothetical protein FKW77_009116 [Venturia effusa]|uniref:Uncharacterized protein n=1 Tax=Venturia effusa TaxID=50376 RepID=A0A517LCV4_9PEZI|nr:hypothetical protein FKW77_009116 [Venturia effusa]
MARLFEVFRDPATPAHDDAPRTPVRAAAPPSPPKTPFVCRRRPQIPGAPKGAQKVYKPKYEGFYVHPKARWEPEERFIQDFNPFELYESPLKAKTTEDKFRQTHSDHARRFASVYRAVESARFLP